MREGSQVSGDDASAHLEFLYLYSRRNGKGILMIPQYGASAQGRWYLLDIVRGLASLAVVIWHYQHFYYVAPGELQPGFKKSAQPFFELLWPAYLHGSYAVLFFFALSGFVFFMIYADEIQRRTVSARSFAINRFSRLYPLHALTLVAVAAGQVLSKYVDGTSIVYPCNSPQFFGLNVLLVMYWLPDSQRCWSFNAPAWSISAEFFLYAMFFLFAVVMPKKKLHQAILAACVVAVGAASLALEFYHLIGEPLMCFFSGGCACLLWQIFQRSPEKLAFAAALAFALSVVCARSVNIYWTGLLTFPSAILFLAALQTMRPGLGCRARVLGDISYAAYMLHFPLQLALILFSRHVINLQFESRYTWVLFFFSVIVLSIVSHRWFEVPMQKLIRVKMRELSRG